MPPKKSFQLNYKLNTLPISNAKWISFVSVSCSSPHPLSLHAILYHENVINAGFSANGNNK
jgi:hypothetical protein